ncbi:MAG: response regulator transcription factor [Terriglobales bacterium]|jgi:DNA-binding response OmpR family regulator
MTDEVIKTESPAERKVPARGSDALRVLIAEDDIPLANFLRRGFQTQSYSVDMVHDGEAAAGAISETKYQLVLLDLNLPKLDGLLVLKKVRPLFPTLPIMVLTARNNLEDKITALDSGADDCVIKPFSFQELTARTRALLRRTSSRSGGTLQVADLVLNRDEFRVERAGKKIDLTAKEFALLEYFMVNARRPVTREMIMENVWKSTYDGSTNLVDVYSKYVRDKVDAGFPLKLIRTIRGIGYVLTDD